MQSDSAAKVLELRIKDGSTLYGRTEQCQKLRELAKSVDPTTQRFVRNPLFSSRMFAGERNRNPSQVAFVHGPSGSGKSSLYFDLAADRGLSSYHFAFGKFGQYNDGSSPYSALVQALDSLLTSRTNLDKNTAFPIPNSRAMNGRKEERESSTCHDENGIHDSLAVVKALDSILSTTVSSSRQEHGTVSNNVKTTSGDGHDNSSISFEELVLNSLDPPETHVLCELVPSFQRLVNENRPQIQPQRQLPTSMAAARPMVSAECLIVGLLVFLRELCNSLADNGQQTIVLALDDLQWADSNSQAVVRALVHHSSDSLCNLLIMGIYRDDDDSIHSLQSFLASVSGKRNVTDISVANLDFHETSMLVFACLLIEKDQAKAQEVEFAHLIYRKTDGNPFFVLQFLSMLGHDELLQYNYATDKFQFDLLKIQSSTQLAENVVEVLTQKVQHLPSHTLKVLRLASCLGFTFDSALLEQIVSRYSQCTNNVFSDSSHSFLEAKSSDSGILPFSAVMESAVAENLIEQSSGTFYKFTHDRIQQVISELIPAGKGRDEIHWQIGGFVRQLIASGMEASTHSRLLLSADQLNQGASCIGSEEERLDLIEWNHEAILMAKQQNGLNLLGLFLDKTMDLIKQDQDWNLHHKCILSIHNTMVEYQSMTHKLEEGIATVQVILENAKHPEDTIVALSTRASIFFTLHMFDSALSDVKEALKLCGETFPPVNVFSIARGIWQTRQLIKGKSDKDLLELPEMSNPHKKQAMKILLTACVVGFMSSPPVIVLSCLSLMKITLSHGFSDLTGTAFASYGTLLARLGDREGGIRFANLALKVSKGIETIDKTVVPAYAYTFILHEILPTPSMMEGWLEGWRKGLEFGDTFHGAIDISLYCHAYKISGLPLDSFAADATQFAAQLKILRRDVSKIFVLPNLQLALILTGQTEYPFRISWDTIRAQGYLNKDEYPEAIKPATFLLDSTQMFLAYILRDTEAAEESLRKILALPKGTNCFDGNHFTNPFYAVTEGLVGFWLGYLKPKSSYRKCGIRALHWLKKKTNINTVPLQKLLEAQQTATAKHVAIHKVQAMYEEVSAMFARSGFVHFAAIANEQLGELFLSRSEAETAKIYLERSLEFYGLWRATVKMQHLIRQHKLDRQSETRRNYGISVRGKERFRTTVDTAGRASLSEEIELIDNSSTSMSLA